MKIFLITVFLFTLSWKSYSQETDVSPEQPALDLEIREKKYPFMGSLKINEKRLDIATGIKNQNGILAAASNLGLIWFAKGDFQKALDYYSRAAEAAVSLNDEKAQAVLHAKTGYTFYKMKMPDQALEYYKKSKALMEKNKMTKALAALEAYTAQVFLESKKNAEALKHFELSMDLFRQSGDKHSLAVVQSRAGEVCLRLSEYDRAINHINAALPELKSDNDSHAIAIAYRDIGLAYYKKGSYEEALDNLNNSIRYNDNLEVKKIIKNTYLKLATISGLQKDAEKSREYNELYVQLRDSINNALSKTEAGPAPADKKPAVKNNASEILHSSGDYKKLTAKELELQKQITAAELEHLTHEKEIEELDSSFRQSELAVKEREAEIQNLQKQQALQQLALSEQQLKISRQSEQRNLLLAGSIALLFGFLFFGYQFHAKKKKHEALNKAFSALEAAHKDLKEAQQRLIRQEKLASLGQLTAGIAHEIKNPLNFVNNFSQVSAELVEELIRAKTDEERTEIGIDLKRNLEKINHHGHRADRIVRNMLEHARSGTGEITSTDIHSLLEEYLALAYHGLRAEYPAFNCEIKKDFDKRISKINCIQQDISRVMLNIMSNAFQAVKDKAGGIVEAGTKLRDGMIEIRIRDNGKGIPAALKEKIFEPFFTTKASGEGTGLGLSISYDIVKSHGGEIKVHSKEGEFTEFTVELPVNA
jgi:signal transduction histidine kinase